METRESNNIDNKFLHFSDGSIFRGKYNIVSEGIWKLLDCDRGEQ